MRAVHRMAGCFHSCNSTHLMGVPRRVHLVNMSIRYSLSFDMHIETSITRRYTTARRSRGRNGRATQYEFVRQHPCGSCGVAARRKLEEFASFAVMEPTEQHVVRRLQPEARAAHGAALGNVGCRC